MSLVVRAAGDERDPAARAGRRAAPRCGPAIFNARTFDGLAGNVDKRRAASVPIGVFGVLTLLLASLGLYGVTAHDVTCGPEIGIRMSLGARRPQVVRLVVRQGSCVADRCGRRDGHQPRGVTHLRGISSASTGATPARCVERDHADARARAHLLCRPGARPR
jgi:hypothetical protein